MVGGGFIACRTKNVVADTSVVGFMPLFPFKNIIFLGAAWLKPV
jgi:hypothetical protein